jgi:hypothetical protein
MTVNGAMPPGSARRTEGRSFEAVCARIGRQVVRDGARRIGFLPVDKPSRQDPDKSPAGRVVEHLAIALTGFVPGDVAIVPAWSTWPPPPPDEPPEATARLTIREIKPRVVEVRPRGCRDGTAAALALEGALRALSDDFAHVMVDLTGYQALGVAPAALGVCEAVVLVATVRRARLDTLRALSEQIPKSKHLGAILID